MPVATASKKESKQYTWDDFMQIASRLDSTINFTLIRFLYKTLSLLASNHEIVLVNATLLLLVQTQFTKRLFFNISVITAIVRSLSSGLIAQALINSATNNDVLISMQLSSAGRVLEQLVVSTAMLLLASIIPQQMQAKEFVARSISILLYMYTDATQNIIQQLELGVSPAFLAVLLSIVLQQNSAYFLQHKTLQFIVKALNMVVINILITSVTVIDTTTSDLHTSTALLIITLFAIDAVFRITVSSKTHMSNLQEGRDYAIWKGGQQLFLVYQELRMDTWVTFVIALLCIMLHTNSVWLVRLLHLQNNTLLEIFLLVVVNVIINQLQTYITQVFSIEQAFVLMMYIITIHTISLYFQQRRQESTSK